MTDTLNTVEIAEEFTANDYETPDREAKLMVSLIKPTDNSVIDPCAGTGQIIKHVDCFRGLVEANEILPGRYKQGKAKTSDYIQWSNHDFLDLVRRNRYQKAYDAVITNPPFEWALDFVDVGLQILNLDNPDARLIYLMPNDTFSSQARSKQWEQINGHIAHIHPIRGRIDYLKNGVPMSKCQRIKDGVPQFKNGKPVMMSGRQVSDSIFIIKPGKIGGCLTYLD